MASKRRLRRSRCGSKVAYRDAVTADLSSRIVGRKYHAWMRPYRCGFCHQWHIGHRQPLGTVRLPGPPRRP